jgi:hypothetical protein
MFAAERALLILCMSVVLCCSSTAQKVKTGHDKTADFSKYQTYTWILPETPSTRPLLREHVIGSVDDELKQKGLQRVEQGGDLTVFASGGIGFDSNLPTGAPVFPSRGGAPVAMDSTMWSGAGVSTGSSGPYVPEGTLGVDLVDREANKLVWRGTVTEKFDIDKKIEAVKRLSKAISKLFKDFPPKKS